MVSVWKQGNSKKIAERVFVLDADPNGNISYNSDKPLSSLQRAELFYLTVERKIVANDSGLVPSDRKLLSGTFSYASSNLSIVDNAANFENLTGYYNLTTPTDGPNSSELSGVWFIDSASTNPVSGLKNYLNFTLVGFMKDGLISMDN